MKIKNKPLSITEVLALPAEKHLRPKKPAPFFRWLLKAVSAGDLKATDFSWTAAGMERLGKEEPALFLMNHSSFIDLKIAATILYPRPFNIVCTSDGFVGKRGLMRAIGCIPTAKFVTDTALVFDMIHAVRKEKSSILLYPEASYSFDGTATPLPDSLGQLLKTLKIPVVMIRTHGAFLRDPLYNNLQLRKVRVRAEETYVLSPEEIREKSVPELNGILRGLFTFDAFREQEAEGVRVTEPFRADGLNRVLYKCPVCGAEGKTEGKGVRLTCRGCGSAWELTETGRLAPVTGGEGFPFVSDWYAWERAEVRRELEEGSYRLDVPVIIRVLKGTKSLYTVGEGRLVHTADGFRLTGCDGLVDYVHKPASSYSLYSDYYWYELGDMICIGTPGLLYYCFPTSGGDVVAKTRLAAEELYKMQNGRR
ncbi:MAG: 1-acyl-sn-glycerol-3-phosphate acyltransferase [Clostridia bacterium]|nr:1-acyl-sn-glycerol-3-phosphate acyltransferase [Clostridia bacterium]